MYEPTGSSRQADQPSDPISVAVVLRAGADTDQFRPNPKTEPLSPARGSRTTADGQFEYLTRGDVYERWVVDSLRSILAEKYRNADPRQRAEIEERTREAWGDRAEVEIKRLRDGLLTGPTNA
jgi:hypothetical protein